MQLRLQAGDEVEHLGLDGRVEARRRLVEDQQGRVGGERHRDHDALLHAAGELMGVAAHDGAGVGDLDARRAPHAPGRSPRRRSPPRMRNTSATCFPIRIEGFRAAPGFW